MHGTHRCTQTFVPQAGRRPLYPAYCLQIGAPRLAQADSSIREFNNSVCSKCLQTTDRQTHAHAHALAHLHHHVNIQQAP